MSIKKWLKKWIKEFDRDHESKKPDKYDPPERLLEEVNIPFKSYESDLKSKVKLLNPKVYEMLYIHNVDGIPMKLVPTVDWLWLRDLRVMIGRGQQAIIDPIENFCDDEKTVFDFNYDNAIALNRYYGMSVHEVLVITGYHIKEKDELK